jgi:hypothetical protein
MGSSGRRRKKDPTEDVRSQLLLSFGLLEGLLPIGGSELQQAVVGPARDEAQQVAQVGERLDAVQPGAGEQRDEDRVNLPCPLSADPILVSDGNPWRAVLLAAPKAAAVTGARSVRRERRDSADKPGVWRSTRRV